MKTTRVALAALLLVASSSARPASVQADDAAADAAAAKLLASKALATTAAPKEQWLGSYAGSCWTQALRVSVVEKDGDLRRIEIERFESRDRELPQRELDKWWVDANGALVRGERKSFEAGHEPPEMDLKYEVKNGKLSVRQVDNPGVATADMPKEGNFLPDKILALLAVPDSKGTVWRFSTIGGEDEFLHFSVEDLGKETVTLRSGTVEARKLKLTEPGGEALYWLDGEHRIVAARWPSLPNLQAIAGTEDESRADWWTRPADAFDQAADKLAKVDGQVGALSFAVYSEEGTRKATVTASLAKEEKDGKAVFHYLSSISEVGSGATVSTEEWWFSPENKVVAGKYGVRGPKVDPVECKLRVEGDKMISSISDAPDGKEELSYPIPPRMVADSYFSMKSAASAGPGSYRLHGFDLAGRYVYSILLTVGAEEEIALVAGKVKARHLVLTQNVAEADAWVDAKGELLLIRWKDGDVNVFGPAEKLPEKLPGHVGPASKE